MDKKKRSHYEKLLLKKKEEIEKSYLQKIEKSSDSGSDGTLDSVDEANVNYNKEYWYSFSDADRKLLRLIDEALQRVKTKSFGECLNCGEEIETKRLDILPWAKYCIKCQELIEEGVLKEEEY